MHEQKKYVIDSRYFNGHCLACMKDGIHSDFGGETLEELRIRENNPFLIAVPLSRISKMLRIYHQSQFGPFKEITEEDYFYMMEILPPLRFRENSFFVGEPFYTNIYPFCFERNDRYFHGLRSIKTPQNELDNQIDRHMEIISRNATILKDCPVRPVKNNPGDAKLISYYFSLDGKQPLFIGNLVMEKRHEETRTDMARTLKSLRNNHYLFYRGKGRFDTPDDMMDYTANRKLTLISNGHFFQYPPNKESVTFVGQIKETGEEFLFRIYDREYFLHLLKRLRSVKKESGHKAENIKA